MESKRGREIHGRSEKAREKEQDFLKALKLIDEATLVYQEDGDYYGMSEVQGSRFNTFKHLYQKTGDKSYLILAKYSALSAVEIGEKAGISESLGIPYRDLGKAYMELEEYSEAIEALRKSLELMRTSPPEIHDTDAIRAEIQGHLGEALYKIGEKETGLTNLNEAMTTLEKENKYYERDVWLSGIYMRLADILIEDDKDKAKSYLDKAKDVIDSNSELKLRLEQWNKLAKTFD